MHESSVNSNHRVCFKKNSIQPCASYGPAAQQYLSLPTAGVTSPGLCAHSGLLLAHYPVMACPRRLLHPHWDVGPCISCGNWCVAPLHSIHRIQCIHTAACMACLACADRDVYLGLWFCVFARVTMVKHVSSNPSNCLAAGSLHGCVSPSATASNLLNTVCLGSYLAFPASCSAGMQGILQCQQVPTIMCQGNTQAAVVLQALLFRLHIIQNTQATSTVSPAPTLPERQFVCIVLLHAAGLQ